MPHFRTWDNTYYDFYQDVDGGTFEFVDDTKEKDPSRNDPEAVEISLLQKNSEPPSPYEGTGDTPPADDHPPGSGNGLDAFGIEDLIGI